MNIAEERPGDELHGDAARDAVSDSLARLEDALRNAGPDFHLRARVKALHVSKAPRGVFVDVIFDKAATSTVLPGRVRLPISRALATSLWQHLHRVLDA